MMAGGHHLTTTGCVLLSTTGEPTTAGCLLLTLVQLGAAYRWLYSPLLELVT